ncbi:hypothetical protein HR060_02370 [Catenovulum sp. SM1970]|uniref:hypothetical protein n=1 Tax=Marinifaba aquimaris TaxID=2741323 RepID=UPI0015727988|nr:hypothetical protein [Marinifaba aquimaris]NTS75700.1 hypothetical protein [Marinifaba aquimaris]
MLITFTFVVICLFLITSVGIIMLCEQVLKYPRGSKEIHSVLVDEKLAKEERESRYFEA